METKNKELYDAPIITIMEVKQEGNICTTSPGSAGVQNYGWHTEDEE